MLEQTALADRAGDEVGKLSGGNRQRVNIAIGLLGDPDVLLLDEPSASLDPRQRDRLWRFIAELGTTVLFATHDVGEAERHADRVLVLADGELLFTGTPAALEATVLFTTHDIGEAARHADRVLVLNDGALAGELEPRGDLETAFLDLCAGS